VTAVQAVVSDPSEGASNRHGDLPVLKSVVAGLVARTDAVAD